jgi:hypothetical protein
MNHQIGGMALQIEPPEVRGSQLLSPSGAGPVGRGGEQQGKDWEDREHLGSFTLRGEVVLLAGIH